MEAAQSVPGVRAIGRASSVRGWTLTPADLTQWGAVWADYSLTELPDVLARLTAPAKRSPARSGTPRRRG
jgi:hypothetical protein